MLLGLALLSLLSIGVFTVSNLRPVQAADNDFSNGITVDSTGDGADANVGDNICDDGLGNCTLRAAIEESNATAGTQTIRFNITGTADFTNGGQNGYTITPATSLPQISDTVIIDGYSQPGAQVNTAPSPEPFNSILLIEIDGADQIVEMFDFRTGSDGSLIRGLVLNRTQSNAIRIIGASNVAMQGNYVGTDPTGLIARPNGSDNTNSSTAIDIGDFAPLVTDTSTVGTLIGGLDPEDRNIVSGNYGGGLGVIGVNSEFYGNYFGLGADGSTTLGNCTGDGVTTGVLTIDYADGLQFGNGQLNGMNIVSGNDRGIQPDFSNDLTFVGNRIGTDYSGTLARPNLRHGISIGLGTTNVRVGGPNEGDGNLVAYNAINGVETWTSGDRVSDVVIQNNTIISNGDNNVAVYSSDNISVIGNIIEDSTNNGITVIDSTEVNIGGLNENDGNTIVDSTGNGIAVLGFQGVASQISIQGNSISGSGNGGILVSGSVTNSLIGGDFAGAANTITDNTNFGVALVRYNLTQIPLIAESDLVSVIGNSVLNNKPGVLAPGLGIDFVELVDDSFPPDGVPESVNLAGPTPNDATDADTGPNNYMNFPEISTADQNLLNLSVNFDLDAADSPTNQYRVEFFVNDTADPSGYGEGQTYLGSTTVSPGTDQTASISLPAGTNLTGKVLSATTTAIDGSTTSGFGSTSEFSQAQAITVSALPSEDSGTNNDQDNDQSSGSLADTGQDIRLFAGVALVIIVLAIYSARRARCYTYIAGR